MDSKQRIYIRRYHVQELRKPTDYRSDRDILVERCAEACARVDALGQGDEATAKATWTRILRWRVRHFAGDLAKALTVRDQGGVLVFAVEVTS